MHYISFVAFHFITALLFLSIVYNRIPSEYYLKIENPYIEDCPICYYNQSGIIYIKDEMHQKYLDFLDNETSIDFMINYKYDVSWDGCNCYQNMLILSCMNLEYTFCTNPIKQYDNINQINQNKYTSPINWYTKVIYFDMKGNKQDMKFSLYKINMKEEQIRLENYFCNVN